MSFNITTGKMTSKKDLTTEIDRQAKPQTESGHLSQDVREGLDQLVGQLPDIKNGYYQLTAYGHINKDGPSNIVVNLSSHNNDAVA